MKKNFQGRWLESCYGQGDVFLREQTKRLGKYGTLTLLWVEENDKEDEDW